MALFIVKTHESVAGTYRVEAQTAEAAEAKFNGGNLPFDWDGVEQIDYMAFSCEVKSVEEKGCEFGCEEGIIEEPVEGTQTPLRSSCPDPGHRCTCSPGVTSVECPWHGGSI